MLFIACKIFKFLVDILHICPRLQSFVLKKADIFTTCFSYINNCQLSVPSTDVTERHPEEEFCLLQDKSVLPWKNMKTSTMNNNTWSAYN